MRRYLLPALDPLPTFEAAARNLSFTRAAEELFLTQSAVSRQIQTLEDQLGMRLFERRHRALLLTEQGQLLFRAVSEALDNLDGVVRRLKSGAEKRAVTITTTPGLAALWLIPRLGEFTREHDGLDVRISTGYDVLPLERARIDVALRYCPADSASEGTRLFDETVFPVCSPSLVRDPARPLREAEDLRRHTLLYYDDSRGAIPWLDWPLWLESVGLGELKPAATLRFGQYDQVIQYALTGQGVALGRSPLVQGLLGEGKLVAPFDRAIASPRAYFLIRAKFSARNPDVDALVAWLLTQARTPSIQAESGKRVATRRVAKSPRRTRRGS